MFDKNAKWASNEFQAIIGISADMMVFSYFKI